MPRVVIAPDKFRGTATAAGVAGAMAAVATDLGWEAVRRPLSDGGEGLLDACAARCPEVVVTRVTGPDGVTRDYYIRQLRDWKGSFDVEGAVPAGLTRYSEVCAQALARAHARSGDRIAIAGYLGRNDAFDQAIATFAETYADQNERDYERFRQAAASGRIAVESGL